MKTLQSISTNPYFNLAWEEYILKNIHQDEDIFLIWRNEPSIIIGRNQNVFEEVNLDYIVKNQIPLIRRNSGGGTVYHDLGNINFTFITKQKGAINNYALMTEKIILALHSLSIPAEFSGKSDIKMDTFKISGNAQYVFKDKLLHHGTLLFNANLEHLKNALKDKENHTSSISVKSNRSQVTNLSSYVPMTIEAFEDFLIDSLRQNDEPLKLTDKDLRQIEKLRDEKYLSYNWNYGESPRSVIEKSLGDYKIKVVVSYGHVEEAFIVKHNSLELNLSSSMVGERCFPKDLIFLQKKAPEVYQMLFT